MPSRLLLITVALAMLLVNVHGAPTFSYAETKTIQADAEYIMGDGETPAFAEAMALQKAKLAALEQAGTYVESYTHIRNLDVTVDEIKTIAGGILETDVIEKKRVLLKDGGERFYTKINARITTTKIEELARHIKGGNAAGENKQVLEAYARIERDLVALKRQMAESKTEQEREIVLDKIRDVEKQFREVRTSETALFTRLLSGEQLSVQLTQALLEQQRRQEEERKRREYQEHALNILLEKLRGSGFTLEIGAPEVILQPSDVQNVSLAFPVVVDPTDEFLAAVHDLIKAHSHSHSVPRNVEIEIKKAMPHLHFQLSVFLKNGMEYTSEPYWLSFRNVESYDLDQVFIKQALTTHINVPKQFVEQVVSVEGRISSQEPQKKATLKP